MSYDPYDIYLGESLSGPQDAMVGNEEILGAAAAAQQQLSALRGSLGQLAQQRSNARQPVVQRLRSPFKDSTQIGVSNTVSLTLNSWTPGGSLPTVTGVTRVYQSFKPMKAILTEIVTATFYTSALGTATRVASVSDSSDLVLTSAFAGAQNCFPNAPTEGNGISGPTFASNSLGNGISWPTINGGIDLTVTFAIEETAIYQVTPPSGYTTDDISAISVKFRFNLLGPSLR